MTSTFSEKPLVVDKELALPLAVIALTLLEVTSAFFSLFFAWSLAYYCSVSAGVSIVYLTTFFFGKTNLWRLVNKVALQGLVFLVGIPLSVLTFMLLTS